MNEDQLKQLADLLKSFGFNCREIEQSVTEFDNKSSKGDIRLKYTTHISYAPKLILNEKD